MDMALNKSIGDHHHHALMKKLVLPILESVVQQVLYI